MDRSQTIESIARTLARDLNCTEIALTCDATTVTESMELDGRRRFPLRPRNLAIVTMGNAVVVSCDASRLQWAKQHLGRMDRDELFSPKVISMLSSLVEDEGQSLAGPDLKYVCTPSTLRYSDIPKDISVDILRGDEVRALYELPGFYHALQYRSDAERPDVLACTARREGVVSGIAGASADCDSFWQVGVDVLPTLRKRGIGKALVVALTRAVFDTGRIPYYSALPSNVASGALAVSVGYWPAWVEMYAR